MPPYTLDYSDHSNATETQRRTSQSPARLLITAGLLILLGVSLAGNYVLLNDQQSFKNNADRLALQNDSLISAKFLSDQQAADLKTQLIQLRQQHKELQDELRLNGSNGSNGNRQSR